MDGYPFDLILTIATASATIFLGFLPNSLRPEFFAREILKAALAWVVVALLSPAAILHYPLFFALLCLGAWWKFRDDNAFAAKIWLNLASGLGLGIGVVFILTVTPRAFPAGLPPAARDLLLASIYLGGAIIGLAYVGYVLAKNSTMNPDVIGSLLRSHVTLLFILVLIRATLVSATLILGLGPTFSMPHPFDALFIPPILSKVFVGLSGIILPCLAFAAWRVRRFGARPQIRPLLLAICLAGLLAEILARLLVL